MPANNDERPDVSSAALLICKEFNEYTNCHDTKQNRRRISIGDLADEHKHEKQKQKTHKVNVTERNKQQNRAEKERAIVRKNAVLRGDDGRWRWWWWWWWQWRAVVRCHDANNKR
jgi:uncharacterized Ntn-hydrolase superfamily protein